MVKKLSDNQIEERMKRVEGWETDDEYSLLQKEFQFKDFADAMRFVNEVAQIAGEENHHPEICISYNTVMIILSTHEVGGLSVKDFNAAGRIEGLIK